MDSFQLIIFNKYQLVANYYVFAICQFYIFLKKFSCIIYILNKY